jgi:hypothetical protein
MKGSSLHRAPNKRVGIFLQMWLPNFFLGFNLMYKCGFTYYLINLVDLVTFIKASKLEQVSIAHYTFKIEHLKELNVIKVLIFLYIILLTMNVTIFTTKNCAPFLINFHQQKSNKKVVNPYKLEKSRNIYFCWYI